MKLRNILIASAAVVAISGAGLTAYLVSGGESESVAGLPAGAGEAIAAAQDQAGSGDVQTVQSGDVTQVGDDEHVLGDPGAPITIIEYSSLTCPHCASFHQDTLPQLKEEWIETGKAKLVYRHYPLDRLALAGALVANCFEGDRFFAVMDMMFAQQRQWARSDNPGQALQKIASQAGMDNDTFNQCISDQQEAKQILDRQQVGRDQAEVQSTPTFLIDGEKLEGAQPYAEFEKALEAAGDGA
jgi:protein-disulfide isomerase